MAHLIMYYLLAWIVLGVIAYSLRGRRRRGRDGAGPYQADPHRPPRSPSAPPRDDHADGGDA